MRGEQGGDGALVPHGDQQRPGQHDEDDGKDVPSLRHLQGWLGPQLLITWAAATRSGEEDGGAKDEHRGEENRNGPGRPGTGTAEKPVLASGSYQRSQPTHCGSRFAESSAAGVSEGVVAAQGAVRNPVRRIPARESRRGWPETWEGGRPPGGPGQALAYHVEPGLPSPRCSTGRQRVRAQTSDTPALVLKH